MANCKANCCTMWAQIFYKDCKLKGTHTHTHTEGRIQIATLRIRNRAQFVQLQRTQKFIDLQLKVDLVFTESRFNLIFQMPEALTQWHTHTHAYIHTWAEKSKHNPLRQKCFVSEMKMHFILWLQLQLFVLFLLLWLLLLLLLLLLVVLLLCCLFIQRV